ncbi:MAG TPA: hypothetical protein HA349_09830 [Methanotrichaceae archaeon]|mgnify:CR=1 FL=1|nr:hypothetical protein [Methanotrichaceae archaeon]
MKPHDDVGSGRGLIIVSIMFAVVVIVLGWITVTGINSKKDLAIAHLNATVDLNQSVNATDILGSKLTIVDAWVAIAFVSFVFLFLIFLGCLADQTLSKGELRRAVAGVLVLAFTILALFSIVMGKEVEIGKEIVIAYIQLVGIATGFYFGAKTAARDEVKPKPEEEKAGKETSQSAEANLEKATEG